MQWQAPVPQRGARTLALPALASSPAAASTTTSKEACAGRRHRQFVTNCCNSMQEVTTCLLCHHLLLAVHRCSGSKVKAEHSRELRVSCRFGEPCSQCCKLILQPLQLMNLLLITMLSCAACRWDARTNTCVKRNLLAFTVARPVDITQMGARKRDAAAPTQVAEASWIYKYGAKKPTDIGHARWIAQVC